MKKVYLVHCWDGTCEDGWYPWIKKELEKYDIECIKFNMPETNFPKIDLWVDALSKNVSDLNEETYFIGHSIGCQTIMRYLEKQDNIKIGGMLFVTPWLKLLDKAVEDEESLKIASPWLNSAIDFEKIKNITNEIYCIFSDNDYFVPIEQVEEFEKKLNSKNIIVSSKGHISQDDGVFELKEILELCKAMLKIL